MTGETITITAPDGDTEMYVARPDPSDGTPLPGVLFLTDLIGLRPRTRAMADRIASWGYVVAVPHLFYRHGTADEWVPPAEDLADPDSLGAFFASALPKARSLTRERARADLESYVDALRALPGVAGGPIGVTGYCMGGRFALDVAAARPPRRRGGGHVPHRRSGHRLAGQPAPAPRRDRPVSYTHLTLPTILRV